MYTMMKCHFTPVCPKLLCENPNVLQYMYLKEQLCMVSYVHFESR